MATSAKTIILHWLDSLENGEVFYSYTLENQVPMYGKLKFNKVHTASTYSRVFRQLREDNLLETLGFKLTPVKHSEGNSKGWIIQNTTVN